MDKDRIHHNEPDSLVQKLYQQVENNLRNEQFGVEQLADNMHMSRSQLHRKLKKSTGQSVNQFIREYRLRKAHDLLKLGEKTVSEVAFEVGFGSHSYFTTCFAEHYGYPPGEVKHKLSEASDTMEEPSHESARQLAAIMFTDIVGYTALMGEDSQKAMEMIHQSKQFQKQLIETHNGEYLKEMGDGILAKFGTALDAVNCALDIQRKARADFEAKLRIGIHSGDIIIENDDIYGDGVNVASRLESIADPGGIYISDNIEKSIRGQTEVQTRYLGEINLKNVDYGVRTYAVQGVGLPIPEINAEKDLSGHFWAEVQRRGLIRVAISYLAAALLLILLWNQCEDWGLHLPQWSFTALLTVFIIGFPMAIYLAWKYERGPQGFVRTTTRASWQNPFQASKRKPLTSNYIILALLLIIALLYFIPRQSPRSAEFRGEIMEKAIAVLPFKNMSGDPEQEALCDGLTDEIIHHLSMIKSFDKVISLSSVMTFKYSNKTTTEIANQLGVDIVLEGSFRQSGDQIKITAQLIDAINDDHLWSEVYEQPFSDIFDVQSDIAKKIAARFNVEITPEENFRIDKRPMENLESYKPTTKLTAYDFYLRGRKFHRDFDISEESKDNENAISMYQQALKLDSLFARAYAGLALSYLAKYLLGHKGSWRNDAFDLVEKAVALNPDEAEFYYLRARVLQAQEGNRTNVVSDLKRAIDLKPNYAEAYAMLAGQYLLNVPSEYRIDVENRYRFAKKALDLDPVNPEHYLTLGDIYSSVYLHDRADQYYKRALQLQPDMVWAYVSLAQNSGSQGKSEETLEYAKRVLEVNPNRLWSIHSIGTIYLYMGEFEKAEIYLRQVQERVEKEEYTEGPVTPPYRMRLAYICWKTDRKPEALQLFQQGIKIDMQEVNSDFTIGGQYYDLAAVNAFLGNKKEAYKWLEKSLLDGWMVFSNEYLIDPLFEPIREEERFQQLVGNRQKEIQEIRKRLLNMENE